MELVKRNEIEEKIIILRGIPVILDSDVAAIYEVETRDINKAVKNNPDKFPKGYLFELDNKEFADLRWKSSTTNLTKTRVLPKAFTEKGLYMLATILKSKKATERTIEINVAMAFKFKRTVKRSKKQKDIDVSKQEI